MADKPLPEGWEARVSSKTGLFYNLFVKIQVGYSFCRCKIYKTLYPT